MKSLQTYKEIALETNKKYTKVLKQLDQAGKERVKLVQIKDKYNRFIEEHNGSMYESYQNLTQFATIIAEAKTSAGEKDGQQHKGTPIQQKELTKYKKTIENLEKNYNKSAELLEKKIETLTQEKDQAVSQLESKKNELDALTRDYRMILRKNVTHLQQPSSGSEAHSSDSNHRGNGKELLALMNELEKVKAELERYKTAAKSQKAENTTEDKKTLRNELERVSSEFNDYKAKTVDKLKMNEENYSAYLGVMMELHSKVETLAEECQYLRSSNEPLKTMSSEKLLL